MSKKVFSLALGALLFVFSFSAQAQQQRKTPRMGFLVGSSAAIQETRLNAFRQGLRELGYVEEKKIIIEYRYGEGKIDRLPALAAELVRLKVDIIVTAGPLATRAAKEVTNTIPIVMTVDIDPA